MHESLGTGAEITGNNSATWRWRFRIKRDENGDIARYKARWCVDGSRDDYYRQPETTYSPVAEHTTIRCLFALAAARKQPVLQADFSNAYLNAEIGEDMYMRQTSGLEEDGREDWVYKLNKALYGSPVSGNRWHRALQEAIEALGYSRSSIGHCLFSRMKDGHTDLLVVYVDDVLVTSTGGKDRSNAQLDELGTKFSIKKLGIATHILGIGVHQGENCTTLDQSAYLKTVLSDNKFIEAKPKGTPWDSHLVEDKELLGKSEIALYRRVVGQLMYLATITRPDIAFAVGRAASGMATPTRGHWARTKRILRYLSGTAHGHLRYERGVRDPTLTTYVDASYGVDPKRGRSISGYAAHLGTGPIYWRSHLQPTVADSPNTAEYIALNEAAKSAVGTHNLLTEMGTDLPAPLLLEDNDGARRLAAAGMGQKKARHLQNNHHYVQELCKKGRITIDRLDGANQPADLLTEGTHTARTWEHLLARLGVMGAC
ncbi:MAG: hypothetical protein GY696_34570 [Gammaproteobacteria bacterium]|nr:hypothetical protein [Gammaproteobacteria bacterium]